MIMVSRGVVAYFSLVFQPPFEWPISPLKVELFHPISLLTLSSVQLTTLSFS